MKLSVLCTSIKAKLQNKRSQVAKWWCFFGDYIRSLQDDRITVSAQSYHLLRKLYSKTKGRSSSLLAFPFQVIHPAPNQGRYIDLHLLKELHSNGYFVLSPTESVKCLANELHNCLEGDPVIEVYSRSGELSKWRTPKEGISSPDRVAPRLNHDRKDVVKYETTWHLIQLLRLDEIANRYLGCSALLTSVDSWHVAPILANEHSNQLYSSAAQTYHYDMDWIHFLKFFINLTDVDERSGPFEFIPTSHRSKHHSYFRDGRFETLRAEDSTAVKATGEAGTFFAADTSGLHRDGRATSASRHVLQVEFAVAAFGAKFQYDDIFRESGSTMPWRYIERELRFGSRTLSLFSHAQAHS
jgi:hypothetical protein